MTDMDTRRMSDWIAIQDLVAEYGQSLDSCRDSGDWSGWASIFAPEVTADLTRVMGGAPITLPREHLAEFARGSLLPFQRTQHATATTVRIRFEGEAQATALAYSEVSHYFTLGGVTQEWTLVARNTFGVVKTEEGWKIARYMLDPIHHRGNALGLELLKGKRLE